MNKELVFSLRKQNLNRLMLDRFQGNRAALARASGVHPNHINLILSNNEAIRRNLGEILARKIEDQLGLPAKWLDSPRDGAVVDAPISIDAPPIHESLHGALRKSEQISGLVVTSGQAASLFRRVTAVESLIIATVDTTSAAPDLEEGDTVVVDTAVKGISVDGIYLISKGNSGPMLRRIGKAITGEVTAAIGSEPPVVLTPAAVKALKVVGRVVAAVRISRL